MNNHSARLAMLMLPLLVAACGTLLTPRPPLLDPWVPTQPIPDPGEQSPLVPQN